MIHPQMSPWIVRQLHPQPRKPAIPALAAPARMRTPALARMSLHFQKLLPIRFGLNAWLSYGKENNLWAHHLLGENILLQIRLAETL